MNKKRKILIAIIVFSIIIIPSIVFGARPKSEYERNLPINKQYDTFIVGISIAFSSIAIFATYYISGKKKDEPIEFILLKFFATIAIFFIICKLLIRW